MSCSVNARARPGFNNHAFLKRISDIASPFITLSFKHIAVQQFRRLLFITSSRSNAMRRGNNNGLKSMSMAYWLRLIKMVSALSFTWRKHFSNKVSLMRRRHGIVIILATVHLLQSDFRRGYIWQNVITNSGDMKMKLKHCVVALMTTSRAMSI